VTEHCQYIIVDYCFTPEQKLALEAAGFTAHRETTRFSPLGGEVTLLAANSSAVAPQTLTAAERTYKRVLDYYFIPTPPEPVIDTALCDHIAGEYESRITVERNIANIAHLLRVGVAALPARPSVVEVLDFGCGSGLVLQSLDALPRDVKESLNITGTDASQSMLAIAEQKGLRVLTLSEWFLLKGRMFDVIVCSYVFHFGLTDDQVGQASRQLRLGGVIVGNFHKPTPTNLEQLKEQFAAVGRTCEINSGSTDNPVVVIR
jgi:predicted TPR repeat methyltransferase